MDVKKLVPWNWFKKEEEQSSRPVPVSRHGYPLTPAFGPLAQLHEEIDRMFDTMWRSFGQLAPWTTGEGWPAAMGGVLKPTLDIGASDKEYTITVEVPGVDEKDIHLELTGNTLTIRGEKRREHEAKDKDFYRVERAYGAFQRILSLPDDADADNIEAAFKKGVLTITIPRRAAAKDEGRTIEIRKAA